MTTAGRGFCNAGPEVMKSFKHFPPDLAAHRTPNKIPASQVLRDSKMRQEVSFSPLRNLFQRNSPGISLIEILFHGNTIEPLVLRILAEPILQAHQSCLGRQKTVRNVRRNSFLTKHWFCVTGEQLFKLRFQLHNCSPSLAGHAIRLEFRSERFRIPEAPYLLHQLLTNI